MSEKTHYHFIIWAAEGKTSVAYEGITYIDLIAESVEGAIQRAKIICPDKKYYWINNIVEHHQGHGKEG
jgi:hypothetical protein